MTAIPFGKKKSAAATVAKVYEATGNPYSAMIEIADRCNEVCVHCYQVQGQKGEMSTAELKSVLDQLAELGVLFLTISGGEATLRSDFLEIVEYARQLKFAVKLYTNGLRITEEVAKALAELAVQEVQISLYSHEAVVHDGITRVPGSFERTVAAIRYLRSAGVAVVMKTPLMTQNVRGYRQWIALAESLDVDFSIGTEITGREDGSREPEVLRASEGAIVEVEADLASRQPERGSPAPTSVDSLALSRRVCGACAGSVHVEPNGEIRPCTQMTVPLGNALREGVAAAWLDNDEAAFIRDLSWGDIHGCRECELRQYCSRCFENARREAGDALGPYAGACDRARLNYQLTMGRPLRFVQPTQGQLSATGPYRLTESGAYAVVGDVLTADDRVLRMAHPWILTTNDTPANPPLVQLRTRSVTGAEES